MLRTLVLVVAGALALLGVTLAIRGQLGAGAYALGIGALILLGTVFERWRYRPDKGRPGAGWEPTGERFEDPQTGQTMQVFYDSRSGERRYVRDGESPQGRGRLMKQTVYEAAGGYDGMLRLADAWHRRVLLDEVVSHAFSHGYHPQHTERLAAYWAEAVGGPAIYSEKYGDETSVVRLHSGNGPHEEMDQRAIACFDEALNDVGLAGNERLRAVLHDYFAWATTTSMNRYQVSADVPPGLRIPKWSWQGLSPAPEDK